MNTVAGKQAVVVGAAHGIGRDIAVALADEGVSLRLVDIANPHAPREVGHFLPPVPEGSSRVCSNDVCVDDRGLMYLVDRGRGVHILERTS